MTRNKKILIICIGVAILACIAIILLLMNNNPGGEPTLQQTEGSVSEGGALPSAPGNGETPSNPTGGTGPIITDPDVPTSAPTTTNPSGESTVPGTQPSDPATQPTNPSTQPTIPGTQPTNPGTQSTVPTTQPTRPGTQTTTPVTQPTQPTTPPATLKINTERNTVVMAGDTLQLDYTYTGNKPLTWTTIHPSRGTVNQKGFVTTYNIADSGPFVVVVTDGELEARVALVIELMEIRTPTDSIVEVGDTLQIDYTFLGDATKLSWSSSDTSVFTIDNKGRVTGVGTGWATAKASTEYDNWSIYINVVDPANKTTHFDMQIDSPLYDGVTKFTGNYLQINAVNSHCRDANNQQSDRISTWTVAGKKTNPSKVNPDSPDRNFYITSSNSKVVSVGTKYSGGAYDDFLYFNKAGTAIITITSWDGYSESYKIYVKDEYDCAPGKEKLTPGEFAYYATMVCDENGIKAGYDLYAYLYIWYSEDELTWEEAKSLGQSNAKREYQLDRSGGLIFYAGWDEEVGKHLFYHGGASVASSADKYTPSSGSNTGKIRFPSSSITMTERTIKLVEVLGDASDEYVVYTSSDPCVETSGGLLLAQYPGTATITATYKGQTATMTVTVTRDPNIQRVQIHVDQITMSVWDVSGKKLSYTPASSDDLMWTSSDHSVATVTQEGHVYPNGPGQCVITVTDGVNSDTCIVIIPE